MAAFRFDFFPPDPDSPAGGTPTTCENDGTATNSSSAGNAATWSESAPSAVALPSLPVRIVNNYDHVRALELVRRVRKRRQVQEVRIPGSSSYLSGLTADSAAGAVEDRKFYIYQLEGKSAIKDGRPRAVCTAAIDQEEREADVVKVAAERDVLTGVYEGGLKVWECAVDLVGYLNQCKHLFAWKDLAVLEAGCGLGLPAIHCLNSGARVCLQDLNVEVLDPGTVATVALNAMCENDIRSWFGGEVAASGVTSPRAFFVAGDWEDLATGATFSKFAPSGFDMILSADTLYAKPQMVKLAWLIHGTLNRKEARKNKDPVQRGEVSFSVPCGLIAAKRYYFGTEGGTAAFQELLSELPSVSGTDDEGVRCSLKLKGTRVISFEDGRSNIRDILAVFWCKQVCSGQGVASKLVPGKN